MSPKISRFVNILTLSLIIVFPTLPAFSREVRTFKDWVVNCESGKECTARTSASGRTDAQTYTFNLMLRKLGDDNRIIVLLHFRNAEPGDGSPFIFEFDDGLSFRFEQGSGYRRNGDEYVLLDEESSRHLVEAMRGGQSLYITFVNPQLRETGLAFSLAGVTASLLWMSE